MNKKILVIVTAMALSHVTNPALAQTSASIVQTGGSNTGSAEQTSAYNATVSIEQTGNGNNVGTINDGGIVQKSSSTVSAKVSEFGSNNSATSSQVNIYNGTSVITQGNAAVSSNNSKAGISQADSNNVTASISQIGNSSSASIKQNQVSGVQTLSGNFSDYQLKYSVYEEINNYFGRNYSYYGNYNFAERFGPYINGVHQYSSSAAISQSGGFRNAANISQANSVNVQASVVQFGSANRADASQTGISGSITNQVAYTGGSYYQYQYSYSGSYGYDLARLNYGVFYSRSFKNFAFNQVSNPAVVTVSQIGNSNNGSVYQTSGGDVGGQIIQFGDNNLASVTQTNVSGRFTGERGDLTSNSSISASSGVIGQVGYANVATINQSNGIAMVAAVAQEGDVNVGMISQLDGINVLAKIEQNGSFNNANLQQIGSRDVALASQNGSNNIATEIQFGSDNFGVVYQMGYNNSAKTEQYGSYNVALISQSGSNLRGTVLQSGNQNFASITQR